MSPKKKIKGVGKLSKEIKIQHLRHDDVPATVGLVKEVRAELVAECRSIRHEMGAMEKRLDGRMGGLDGGIEQVLASVHRTQALMEEQRGENKVVLDGIKSVMDRQDRAEEEAKEFRETLQVLGLAQE